MSVGLSIAERTKRKRSLEEEWTQEARTLRIRDLSDEDLRRLEAIQAVRIDLEALAIIASDLGVDDAVEALLGFDEVDLGAILELAALLGLAGPLVEALDVAVDLEAEERTPAPVNAVPRPSRASERPSDGLVAVWGRSGFRWRRASSI